MKILGLNFNTIEEDEKIKLKTEPRCNQLRAENVSENEINKKSDSNLTLAPAHKVLGFSLE